MAQYTVLNKHELASIFEAYSSDPIISSTILSGGSENSNYQIVTKSGKYVVSICEQKTKQAANDLTNLLMYLEKHGFQTSTIIPTKKDEMISLWKTKPIMIKKFIEGKIVENMSNHLLELLGKEMGKLHLIEAPKFLPKTLNYGKEQFNKVQQYAANSSFEAWLNKQLEKVLPYLTEALPKALVHSDIFCDNVIVSEDEQSVQIMDFEEAANYYRIFDLGIAIIGTCAEEETINLNKASHLLQGYQQFIQLLNVEKEALRAFTIYAGTCMTFWRHQQFNYVKPDPNFANHYLGLKVLVDDLEQYDNETFLKIVCP